MIAEESRYGEFTHSAMDDGRKDRAESKKWQGATQRIDRKFANGIASHPLVTAAFAVAIGVTLGWLVKRR